MTNLETVRSAARKSAREAYDQLASTEPERSRQVDGLTTLPDEFWIAEKDWLEGEFGRKPTEEEKEEYVSTWEEEIQRLKEEDEKISA